MTGVAVRNVWTFPRVYGSHGYTPVFVPTAGRGAAPAGYAARSLLDDSHMEPGARPVAVEGQAGGPLWCRVLATEVNPLTRLGSG